jgi:hypothetical protein
VHLSISTDPPGADIVDDATGELLGQSPADLSFPRDSGDRVLLFRHPGCGEKRKTVRTSSDAELQIMLDVLPRKKPRPTIARDADPDLLQPKF